MNDNREAVSAALEQWSVTLDTLIRQLVDADEDASHEAVSILLVQGLGLFGGPVSVVMQESFPVLDAIQKKVDASDLDGALRQALVFRQQLEEIRDLVRTEGN